jgi:hypothetical protein
MHPQQHKEQQAMTNPSDNRKTGPHTPRNLQLLALIALGFSALCTHAYGDPAFEWSGDVTAGFVKGGLGFSAYVLATGLSGEGINRLEMAISGAAAPQTNPDPTIGDGNSLPIMGSYTATLAEGSASITITVSVSGVDSGSDFRTVVPLYVIIHGDGPVGMWNESHDRSRPFAVEVVPSGQVNNVTLTMTDNLLPAGVDIAGGWIYLGIVGTGWTMTELDHVFRATHTSGVASALALSVVIPYQIGTHPTFNGNVTHEQRCLDEWTVPAFHGLPPGFKQCVRIAGTTLTVPVLDQFTHATLAGC